jgi:ABC-2 type transport system permease protein
MNSFSKVSMLVRREVWENRSLWIAPLVIAGIILFAACVGRIHVGDGGHFWFGGGWGPADLNDFDPGPERRRAIYGMTMVAFTLVQLLVLGVVLFFYLLDSLLGERKDRSILFWKSLPISDTQVVASKALTALVLAPLYVLAVSAVTQLLFGIVWFLRVGHSFPANVLVPFDVSAWFEVQVGYLALVPTVILWYLPIVGYLLLVSVWARKNAFLWAVLPPAALLLVEGLLMQSHHLANFLGHRFGGVFKIIGLGASGDSSADSLGELFRHLAPVYTNAETWLGVLAAAAFFFAVIRIRRYRDDS